MTETERLRTALQFYANDDNYWNKPLPLNGNYDLRTLRAAKEAERHNKVLADRGNVAREALRK